MGKHPEEVKPDLVFDIFQATQEARRIMERDAKKGNGKGDQMPADVVADARRQDESWRRWKRLSK